VIEAGAGEAAGYPDAAFEAKGARVISSRAELLKISNVVLQVRTYGSNPEQGEADFRYFHSGQVIIGFSDPLSEPGRTAELAGTEVTCFSMELMPRITRAQSMDALSSMATIAGYKSVLLAANHLPKMFPLLMTAAGTVAAAKVFVLGAGVAGLQAIATSRRLGGIVHAWDIRPAVREQVESLGAKFVELPLEAAGAETKGGYAKAQDEEFYRRQQDLMAHTIAESDVVITTAAVPGKKAPVLVTADMVRRMASGSVIVDLGIERGGNCELTRADEVVVEHGVSILGPTNVPASVPYHASQMYAKNISNFLAHIAKNGEINLDQEDEILRETLLTRDGKVVNPRVRELLEAAKEP
jgi:NAD(P) transhydrogenase subunit alpha